MRTHSWIASIVTGSVMLAGPATSLAASADIELSDVSEEELIEMLEQPAMPQSALDGRGGGGYGIMAPYYGGGVQVDASVTKEVTPDFVAINAYCSSGRVDSREEARDILDQIYQDIRAAVGSDGRVRKMGSMPVYPVYGQNGEETGSFTADMSLLIRIVDVSAAQRISDAVEDKTCSVNWDVRLLDTQSFEMSVLDELSERLSKRKTVFETLLGKKLNTVIGATLSTWVDGYGTYDPETNKVDGTTTLSISFDLGANTKLPANSTRRTTAPRG